APASAAPAATVPRPGPAAAPASTPPPANRTSVIPAPGVSVGPRTVAAEPPAPAAAREPAPATDAEIPVPLVARRLETPREDELEISVEVGPPSSPMVEVAIESMPI